MIDLNWDADKNDMIVHVILSNIDTDGINGTENKKRLEVVIKNRFDCTCGADQKAQKG